MKVIILDGGNKLIYRNKDEYTIKTSFGNFTCVNEAVEKVPVIKESKNIKKCEWCNKYFIKQKKSRYFSYLLFFAKKNSIFRCILLKKRKRGAIILSSH